MKVYKTKIVKHFREKTKESLIDKRAKCVLEQTVSAEVIKEPEIKEKQKLYNKNNHISVIGAEKITYPLNDELIDCRTVGYRDSNLEL